MKSVTGWHVVEEYDGLRVRSTDNELAEPTYAQERDAWYRYLRAHKYGVTLRRGPRGFANEFDLSIFFCPGLTAADTREDAELLARPYGGEAWYGSITLTQEIVKG